MTSNRSQPLDRNGNVIMDSDWSCVATKTMTFDGATENDPGDEDGTGNPADLFIVSGTVLMRILAICNTDLAGVLELILMKMKSGMMPHLIQV